MVRNNTAAAAERQPGRNYGIDALRIVAMFMIPLLHVLGHGGILQAAPVGSANYCAAYLLEAAAYCAVDVYALISGYVGYGHTVKYANIFYLTLQVLFYTVSITGLFLCFAPDTIGIKTLLQAAFPAFYNVYWYFQAYVCLFFLMPYLNLLLDKMSGKQADGMMALVFLYSVLSTVLNTDMAKLHFGSSAAWLVVLYLMGGYLKKYDAQSWFARWKCAVGYLVNVIITWLSILALD